MPEGFKRPESGTLDDLQNAIDSLDGVAGSNKIDVILDNHDRACWIAQELRDLAIALIKHEVAERENE